MRQIAFPLALFTVLAASRSVPSQTTRQPVVPPGTVTGHLTLDDTGGPARFASVLLEPVVLPKPDKPQTKTGTQPDVADLPQRTSRVVHSLLDGSFTVPDVAPGNYYVLADAPGYISAAGVLTRDEMDHPTKKVADEIRRLLVPVAVASGKTSQADVTLHHGAALSGTVRFDDGSPYAGAGLTLLRQNEKGEWQSVTPHLLSASGSADDTGRFRFSGLNPGAYRISVGLSIDTIYMEGEVGQPNGWYSNDDCTLKIFYPDATREKDARTIDLKAGEDNSSLQLEVPLAKLHSLRGALVLKGTSHPVNAGHISLVFPDDNKELTSVDVHSDDGSFDLPFVPEGTYQLKVIDAEEVSRTDVPNPPGMMPPFNTKTDVLRHFGAASQPLIVTTDAQGILVAVPTSGDTAPGTPATQAGTAAATP